MWDHSSGISVWHSQERESQERWCRPGLKWVKRNHRISIITIVKEEIWKARLREHIGRKLWVTMGSFMAFSYFRSLCVYVCVWTRVYVLAEARGWQVSSPIGSTLFFETISQWTSTLLSAPLARELHGSACLHSPSTKPAGAHHHSWPLCIAEDLNSGPCCVAGILPTEPSPQPSLVIFRQLIL